MSLNANKLLILTGLLVVAVLSSGYWLSNITNFDNHHIVATSPVPQTQTRSEIPLQDQKKSSAELESQETADEAKLPAPPTIPFEVEELNRDIAAVVEGYQLENLTSLDCELMQESVQNLYRGSEVARARGFSICLDCPDYAHMQDLSLTTLKDMSENNDFEAMHLYAEKLMQQEGTRMQAIKPLTHAAIRGSVTALYGLQNLYLANHETIAEDDIEAKNFNQLMIDSYQQLALHRLGISSEVDNIEEDGSNLLHWTLSFHKRLWKKQRTLLGLPPMQNVPIAQIPVQYQQYCAAL